MLITDSGVRHVPGLDPLVIIQHDLTTLGFARRPHDDSKLY